MRRNPACATNATSATTQCAHKTVPSREEISNALSGNLCRCTGYRPIVDAAEQMFDRARSDRAGRSSKRWRRSSPPSSAMTRSSTNTPAAASTRRAPSRRSRSSKAERPATRILAGSTDVGLWVTKQMRDLGDIVYVGQIVVELQTLRNHATNGSKSARA